MFICNMPRLALPSVKHPELLRHYLANYGSITLITLYKSGGTVGVQRVLALIHYFYKYALENNSPDGILRFTRCVLDSEETN